MDTGAPVPPPMTTARRARSSSSSPRRFGRALFRAEKAAVAAGSDPAGEAGEEITALHHRWLTVMGDKYDLQRHRGLAELYVQDERFTAYYDRERPGCARFLRDAVLAWAK